MSSSNSYGLCFIKYSLTCYNIKVVLDTFVLLTNNNNVNLKLVMRHELRDFPAFWCISIEIYTLNLCKPSPWDLFMDTSITNIGLVDPESSA